MNSNTVTITIADVKVNIELHYEKTALGFRAFLTDYDENALQTGLTEKELAQARTKYPDFVEDYVIEFNELLYKVCNMLLKLGMPTFHGTAFTWNEKAWIFAAPSGTGKTTQYVLWKAQFRDEIYMLNGDKTVLRCEDDGSISVFPTPWAGKEGMCRMVSAPLGGIILLSQHSENIIELMEPCDCAKMLARQFIFTELNAENKSVLDRTLNSVLSSIPVWHLKNKGDLDSARLAHDTILASM